MINTKNLAGQITFHTSQTRANMTSRCTVKCTQTNKSQNAHMSADSRSAHAQYMSGETKISAEEDYMFPKSTQERRPKDMRMRRSILTKKLGISTNTKPVPVITKSGTSFLLISILPTSQILFSLFQLNMILYM